jgi:hypothetical protein
MKSLTEFISNAGFIPGRMISGSKTAYRNKYPENEVYFNCNIFVLGEGKIWYGDLDLTKDEPILRKLAKSMNQSLYILMEYDGRFENENLEDFDIVSKAVKIYHP